MWFANRWIIKQQHLLTFNIYNNIFFVHNKKKKQITGYILLDSTFKTTCVLYVYYVNNIPWQCLPSGASAYPYGHMHLNDPGTLWQRNAHWLDISRHSLTSSQTFLEKKIKIESLYANLSVKGCRKPFCLPALVLEQIRRRRCIQSHPASSYTSHSHKYLRWSCTRSHRRIFYQLNPKRSRPGTRNGKIRPCLCIHRCRTGSSWNRIRSGLRPCLRDRHPPGTVLRTHLCNRC